MTSQEAGSDRLDTVTKPLRASKKIGLIGGLAFRAGIFYYDQLLQRFNSDGAPLELVLQHADVKKVLAFAGPGSK